MANLQHQSLGFMGPPPMTSEHALSLLRVVSLYYSSVVMTDSVIQQSFWTAGRYWLVKKLPALMQLELSMCSQNSPPLYLSLSQFNTVYTLTTYYTELSTNCLPYVAKEQRQLN